MLKPSFSSDDFKAPEPYPCGTFEVKVVDARCKEDAINTFENTTDPLFSISLEIIRDAKNSVEHAGRKVFYQMNLSAKKKLIGFYVACGYSKLWVEQNGAPEWDSLTGTLLKIKIEDVAGKKGGAKRPRITEVACHAATQMKLGKDEVIAPF